ncbi:sulfotransferase [Wenxinia saemankumensis]|uniref:Sulfotransferase family protein n=1 Tax=Wenxinia saemankumensis TaxID=1447782 RepID=A0A1M6AZ35_9RHOB|nr:sulfotransferase [Wenxinia saemankumensis]SHI41769.1 Sulfotransferase family protein [Wenxinia saemankumensis]
MGQPLLICLGATKAGTSWLYRSLADHPDTSLPAVKELHYFDTFDAGPREKQLAAYRARLSAFEAARDEAGAAGRGWQARNMARRIADMRGTLSVMAGARDGDAGYLALMDEIGQGRLTADMTPNYALADDGALARLAVLPGAVFVYLVRDPLARLWSHVRMQAERQRQPGEDVPKKANATLWRILNRGQETHVLHRGDYAAAIARLEGTLPPDRFRVEVMERLTTPSGWAAFCRWLGLAPSDADGTARVHEGPKIRMRGDLRVPALKMLKDQYAWARARFGDLPPPWADNMREALS